MLYIKYRNDFKKGVMLANLTGFLHPWVTFIPRGTLTKDVTPTEEST